MRITQSESRIDGAECGPAELPGTIARSANRQVWDLHAKNNGVEKQTAIGRFVSQVNVIAARLNGEAQMNPGVSRAVSIKDEELARPEQGRAIREGILVRQGSVISKSHAGQID